jgi:AcrR family transcriptional regulator
MPTRQKKRGSTARPAPARRASRVRGERTRQSIVAATQQVIAREGVGAVSHRSVAQEAGVNLSLTTYYFVDLYDLIAAAFKAFSDGGQGELSDQWQRGFQFLSRIGRVPGSPVETRRKIRNYALKSICDHIESKVTQDPIGLAIEHQFFFAALNDPRLVQMATAHRTRVTAPLIELFRVFGSPQPEVDADLMFGTVIRLEYEALLHDSREADSRRVRREIKRLLDLFLGLPAGR